MERHQVIRLTAGTEEMISELQRAEEILTIFAAIDIVPSDTENSS